MDAWSFASEGKGLLFSDEMDLSLDALVRSKKSTVGWDFKSSCGFENNGILSDKEAVERTEFMDLGFPDMSRRCFNSDTSLGISGGGGYVRESSKRLASPACMITSNSSFGEEESGSKISSSLMESNSQDSSLIDLKLGRLADGKVAVNLKERSVVSSRSPTFPAKRARTASSYTQNPCCQVYGCNMDLSSSKEYHKRHKVCEVHSKTARVIVNGKEQRFCQQCSRFHLLAEFDDGKRSCRKRLAGHNERRRKPQFSSLSSRPHKLLQSYQDAKYLESSLSKKAPFQFPGMFPSGILYPERYEQAILLRNSKLEGKSIYNPQFTMPMTSEQFLPKSLVQLRGNGKPLDPGICPSAIEDGAVFNMQSSIYEDSGVSHSRCALSLLSAQSHNLSSHSADIQVDLPVINQTGCGHQNAGRILDKPIGAIPLGKYAPNGFYSSGMNSTENVQAKPVVFSNIGNPVNFEVQENGFVQGSELLHPKYCLCPEHGNTVDLLQLSSHLQRVERQRNYVQVKKENENVCCYLTT